MKKIFSFILAMLCLTLFFTACAPTSDEPQGDDSSEPTDTTEDTSEEPEPPKNLESVSLSFDSSDICVSKGYNPNKAGQLHYLNTSWKSTEYVDVTKYHGFWYELAGHKYVNSVSFFDADKKFISGKGTTSTCSATICQGFIERPENAVYARFTYLDGSINYNAGAAIKAMTPEDVCVIGYLDEPSYEYARKDWKNDGLVISCIGDSLTEGDYGATGYANRQLKNYPYFLSKALGCETINYGKCGYASDGALELYNNNQIDISASDVIIVMLGTNRGLKADPYTTSYVQLVEKILADKKQDAHLVLVTPPISVKSGFISSVSSANEFIMGQIKTQYGSRTDVTIVDAFKEGPIQKDNVSQYMPVDGLHMSREGYKLFAEYLAKEIEEILK